MVDLRQMKMNSFHNKMPLLISQNKEDLINLQECE